MEYLYQSLFLRDGQVVEVELGRKARVLLLTSLNYQLYKQGRSFDYYGGRAISSPVRLAPPRTGQWNLVIELDEDSTRASYSVKVLDKPQPA